MAARWVRPFALQAEHIKHGRIRLVAQLRVSPHRAERVADLPRRPHAAHPQRWPHIACRSPRRSWALMRAFREAPTLSDIRISPVDTVHFSDYIISVAN